MKRSFIFLLGLLCIIMVEAKNHYFKHLGVSDGLSQVCIFSIYQDELGAVWLGTSEGLNRYNGKDVKITIDGSNVMVNQAKVIAVDIEASNGVIHVIDQVIIPES